MSRNHLNRTSRRHASSWLATSAVAFAAGIGAAVLTAAPARADHIEGAVASHVARVAVSHFALAHEILLGPTRVVEVHRYGPPPHRHHAHCGHGHGYRHGHGHGKHHGHHARGHGRDHYASHGGHGAGARHGRVEVAPRRGGRH